MMFCLEDFFFYVARKPKCRQFECHVISGPFTDSVLKYVCGLICHTSLAVLFVCGSFRPTLCIFSSPSSINVSRRRKSIILSIYMETQLRVETARRINVWLVFLEIMKLY